MKCKDCPYFHIRQRPIKGWDMGLAERQKHGLVVDFVTMRKVNGLECVEGNGEDRQEQAKKDV